MSWGYEIDSYVNSAARLCLTLLLLVMIGLYPSSTVAQTPHFDRLQERFASNEMVQASFIHTYQDSYTGEETRSEGEIWIAQQSYRVEDARQAMVVDGEISRIFDRDRNRLLINSYIEEEDDFAPSRMLQGVQEAYRAREVRVGTGVVIHLETDDPFELFPEVEIHLDDSGAPRLIRAVDQAENILVTRFERSRFLPYNERIMDLDLPANVERIDLRE